MHAQTTIIGHLADDPVLTKTTSGNFVCRLRVASSRRVRKQPDRQAVEQARSNLEQSGYSPGGAAESTRPGSANDGWVDQDLLFIDVECWGQLAINAKKSLQKGRPIMASGYLYTNTWVDEKDGKEQVRSVTRLKASALGLELSRYVAGSRKSVPNDEVAIDGLETPDPTGVDDSIINRDYSNRPPAEPSQEEGEQVEHTEHAEHTEHTGHADPSLSAVAC